MTALLEVSGLSRRFGGFTAVEAIDFHVEEGEILGLVGPNGAGKTTTFNLLSGFLRKSGGTVRFDGHDVSSWPPHRLAEHGLVRTFQNTRVFESTSVADNIRIASHKSSAGGIRRLLLGSGDKERQALDSRLQEILELVGLADKAGSTASDLPYGEQRLLEIAIALAAEPRLLLLDEPFAGMNDAECAACMELIHTIRERGITVVVIDHHMDTMARGCDRLVVMHYGQKLAEGSPRQVTTDELVIEAYLGSGELVVEIDDRVAATDASTVLELVGSSVRYGPVEALRAVDLRVGEGEIVALVGSNGAGKTSALRAISGLLPLSGGSIRFAGLDLGRLQPDARVRLGVAHCPEGREIFPLMTVLENLELGALVPRTVDEGLERVFELFPRLAERRKQAAGSLSGGEQQMLAIGRALMSKPRILLLDEPSLGLAPVLTRDVARAIVALNQQGVAVLLVEQNASLALAIAHRAYVLTNGRITLSGDAEDVRNDPTVKEAYLGV